MASVVVFAADSHVTSLHLPASKPHVNSVRPKIMSFWSLPQSPLRIVNYQWSDIDSDDDGCHQGWSDTDNDDLPSLPQQDSDPSTISKTSNVSLPQQDPAVSTPDTSSLTSDVQNECEPPISNQTSVENDSSRLPASPPLQFDDSDSDEYTAYSLPPACKKVRKYAMTEDELPVVIEHLLDGVKKFFTKSLNLKRLAPAISKSTFDKAHERICCKYYTSIWSAILLYGRTGAYPSVSATKDQV